MPCLRQLQIVFPPAIHKFTDSLLRRLAARVYRNNFGPHQVGSGGSKAGKPSEAALYPVGFFVVPRRDPPHAIGRLPANGYKMRSLIVEQRPILPLTGQAPATFPA